MTLHRSAHRETQLAIETAAAQERADTLNWVVAFLAARGFPEAAETIKAEVLRAAGQQTLP